MPGCGDGGPVSSRREGGAPGRRRRYASEANQVASDFLSELEHATRRVASFPHHGSPYLQGTRRVLLRRFPFSVVYVTEAESILVVAVVHHSRRPGYWLDRL